MKNQKINQIIADYEGYSIKEGYLYKIINEDSHSWTHSKELYTESIDSLVGPWKKLENIGFVLRFDKGEFAQPHCCFAIDAVGDEYPKKMDLKRKLSETLALATAEAVLKITKCDNRNP